MKTWKKQYKNYSLEDLLVDDSYLNWVLNGKDQTHPWAIRIKDSDYLDGLSAKAEVVITVLHNQYPIKDIQRANGLKEKIDNKIESLTAREHFARQNTAPLQRRSSFKVYWRIAASVALLVVSYFMLTTFFDESKIAFVDQNEVKVTKKGQKLTVHLRDGSKIRLNSNSSIEYPKDFTDTSRVVYLTGEAFFDVEEDPTRPFSVIAQNTETVALGTSFNIRSDVEQKTAKISLVTGKVRVRDLELGHTTFLMPGDYVLGNDEGLNAKGKFEYEDIAWNEDVLIFNNSSKQEVFERLEDWYGVNFRFVGTNRLENWNYSGKFKNESINSVLLSIGHAENFSFEIGQDNILIKHKNLTPNK